MPKDGFLIGVLIAVLIISAVIDYRLQKIPNIITYPTMALAVGFHSFTHGGNGLYFSLSGLMAGIALLILPYFLGGMGAGDAKLMGAVGAVVGPREVFIAFLYSSSDSDPLRFLISLLVSLRLCFSKYSFKASIII